MLTSTVVAEVGCVAMMGRKDDGVKAHVCWTVNKDKKIEDVIFIFYSSGNSVNRLERKSTGRDAPSYVVRKNEVGLVIISVVCVANDVFQLVQGREEGQ